MQVFKKPEEAGMVPALNPAILPAARRQNKHFLRPGRIDRQSLQILIRALVEPR
jgi:hypothetical protein